MDRLTVTVHDQVIGRTTAIAKACHSASGSRRSGGIPCCRHCVWRRSWSVAECLLLARAALPRRWPRLPAWPNQCHSLQTAARCSRLCLCPLSSSWRPRRWPSWQADSPAGASASGSSRQPVGISAVRQKGGGQRKRRCSRVLVMTNSHRRPAAPGALARFCRHGFSAWSCACV